MRGLGRRLSVDSGTNFLNLGNSTPTPARQEWVKWRLALLSSRRGESANIRETLSANGPPELFKCPEEITHMVPVMFLRQSACYGQLTFSLRIGCMPGVESKFNYLFQGVQLQLTPVAKGVRQEEFGKKVTKKK